MPVVNNEFIDAIREVVGTTVRKHKRKISDAVAEYMNAPDFSTTLAIKLTV